MKNFLMLNIYNQQNNNHEGGLAEEAVKTKKTHADSGRYEDVSGDFSSSQFKRSVWFAKHKVALYKMTVFVLIVASIGFWVYGLIGIGDYIVNGIKQDALLQRNLASFPDYSGLAERYGAKPLQVDGLYSYANGSKAYNLTAQVTNLNNNFIVHFDYHFVVGTESTPSQHGFILAGQSVPLTYFGYNNSLNGFNLVFENVVWKRVSLHTIKNAIDWQNERLNFVISDFAFSSAAGGTDVSSNRLTFKLQNNSSYNYKHADFIVGLMQSGSLASVMLLSLDNFQSLETRDIDLRNYDSSLLANDVVVYPMIDIYDPSVYLAPGK